MKTILKNLKYQFYIVLLLGLLFNFLSYHFIQTSQLNTIKKTFIIAAEERIEAFKKQLHLDLDLILSVGSLFAASEQVDRYEFQTFTKGIFLENRSIQAMEWVPVISDIQRFAFEEKIRDSGISNFYIKEKRPHGLVKAKNRQLYYPVTYVEPFNDNREVLGYDMGSDATRLQALKRATETGTMTISGRINLVQNPAGGSGFLAYLPVYRKGFPIDTPEQRKLNIEGLVLGVYRVGDILENAIKNLANRGINVFLFDDTDAKKREMLYYHIPRLNDSEKSQINLNDLEQGLFYKVRLGIGGRTWTIICQPSPKFYALIASHEPQVIFLFGILLSLVLALYVNHMIVHTQMVEKKVKERTAEFSRVNEELLQKTTQLQETIMKIEEQNLLLENTKKATLNLLEDIEKSKAELELANRQLAEQKTDLEQVNLELDRFVYTTSHDLRAPLRAISSFATFLQEDYQQQLDAEGRDHLQEIIKGATRLNRLLDDLLSLSRITRIKNPYETVSMNNLIKTACERLEFDIHENKVQMIIPDNLPEVICDKIKIGEVFLNLINNAIKFSSKNNLSQPRVEIGGRLRKDSYEFFVKDNGIGIAPTYQQQVFGMFKRLHKEHEYEGTGAGLNIVKRIIEDHGGKIWIDSDGKCGSIFYFTIPRQLKIRTGSDGRPQSSNALKPTSERQKSLN